MTVTIKLKDGNQIRLEDVFQIGTYLGRFSFAYYEWERGKDKRVKILNLPLEEILDFIPHI